MGCNQPAKSIFLAGGRQHQGDFICRDHQFHLGCKCWLWTTRAGRDFEADSNLEGMAAAPASLSAPRPRLAHPEKADNCIKPVKMCRLPRRKRDLSFCYSCNCVQIREILVQGLWRGLRLRLQGRSGACAISVRRCQRPGQVRDCGDRERPGSQASHEAQKETGMGSGKARPLNSLLDFQFSHESWAPTAAIKAPTDFMQSPLVPPFGRLAHPMNLPRGICCSAVSRGWLKRATCRLRASSQESRGSETGLPYLSL